MGSKSASDRETDFHTIDAESAGELIEALPSGDSFDALEAELKMISNTTRLKILGLLGQRDLCVHDITTLLEMSQSAISHQLKQLRNMGILNRRKEGRVVYYSLDRDKLRSILGELEEVIS